MPELPEVEATRRSLATSLVGALTQGVRMGQALRWPLGCAPDRLVGLRVRALERRSKYLILQFEGGAAVLLHLGMSGSLSFVATPIAPGKHDHFDLQTDRGTLRLNDPRRFGAVVFVSGLDDPRARRLLARLGPEPMDDSFDPKEFHAQLHSRGAAVKSLLLSGALVVGVGNIYAAEALFLAGIRPTTAGRRIGPARALALHLAIRKVLGRAIDLGGTTLRNFSDAHGHSGAYQDFAMVYGREGLPCKVCSTPIRRIVQGQRSSFYCPKCQKP